MIPTLGLERGYDILLEMCIMYSTNTSRVPTCADYPALRGGGTAVNETDTASTLKELTFQWRRETQNNFVCKLLPDR